MVMKSVRCFAKLEAVVPYASEPIATSQVLSRHP